MWVSELLLDLGMSRSLFFFTFGEVIIVEYKEKQVSLLPYDWTTSSVFSTYNVFPSDNLFLFTLGLLGEMNVKYLIKL